MLLDGRKAIVVGGGQSVEGEPIGIGRAVALTYASEGAQVVVVDKNEAAAQATVTLIESAGGQGWALRADITQEEDCREMAKAAAALMGGIDALHNNVGGIRVGTHIDAHIDELTVAAFRAISDMSLMGMWLSCKHVLPIMKAQGQGSIVNVSSIASVLGGKYDYNAAYRLSKGGVNVLTNLIAMDFAAYGIRANALLVGAIDTANSPSQAQVLYGGEGVTADEFSAASVRDIPLRRRGTGWDVAKASAFLASDSASFITGAYLPVDGGQSARVR